MGDGADAETPAPGATGNKRPRALPAAPQTIKRPDDRPHLIAAAGEVFTSCTMKPALADWQYFFCAACYLKKGELALRAHGCWVKLPPGKTEVQIVALSGRDHNKEAQAAAHQDVGKRDRTSDFASRRLQHRSESPDVRSHAVQWASPLMTEGARDAAIFATRNRLQELLVDAATPPDSTPAVVGGGALVHIDFDQLLGDFDMTQSPSSFTPPQPAGGVPSPETSWLVEHPPPVGHWTPPPPFSGFSPPVGAGSHEVARAVAPAPQPAAPATDAASAALVRRELTAADLGAVERILGQMRKLHVEQAISGSSDAQEAVGALEDARQSVRGGLTLSHSPSPPS